MPHPTRTILVIEDSELFRDLEARFLGTTGRVVTAPSGPEALEAVRRERPSVVVAAFDLGHGGGDGLCKEIKSDPELEGIGVVLVTSIRAGEERAQAVRAGADEVVAKPVDRPSLIAAVSRFVQFAEVRAARRVPLLMAVSLRQGAREGSGEARNLSRGGVFVATDTLFEVGSELDLEFELPDEKQHVSATARVRWCRAKPGGGPPGMGLQFLALPAQAMRDIADFVNGRSLSDLGPP